MRVMFNSRTKVNILLYSIALSLKLAVKINVTVWMKEIRNHKSLFIKYVSNISVKIKNVIVHQSFFVLEKESIFCILERSFKIITCMLRQIMNDESVQLIIFDSENNLCQTTFQVYKPGDAGDKQEYKIMQKSIHKNLN